MSSAFYLLGPFQTILVSDPYEWLGKIVRTFANPTANYVPQVSRLDRSSALDDDGFTNIRALIAKGRSASASLRLEGLFAAGADQQAEEKPAFEAPRIRKIRLSQDEDHLQEALKDPRDLEKVLSWLGMTRPAYFVVGVLVADNVVFSDAVSKGASGSVAAQVPVKALLASQGIIAPGPEPVEGRLAQSRSTYTAMSGQLERQRIFAIEYRVIKRRILAKHAQVRLSNQPLPSPRLFAGSSEDVPGVEPSKIEQNVEIKMQQDPLSEVDDGAEEYCLLL